MAQARTQGHDLSRDAEASEPQDYMADSTEWAVELVHRVGSERFKLLYDIYHCRSWRATSSPHQANHQHFAHYHIAGIPGRTKRRTQELNYPRSCGRIAETGYKGYVAYEYSPRLDALASLRQAVQICDV